MSIFEYNGSALVAMVGKNCFAIASDRRLGVQLQTIATDFQRIFKIHEKLFIGLSGLATDTQTLHQRLVFRHKLYELREERDMKPETFASLVSAILYEKRFGPYLCQPVIAGLGDDDKPFICTMDSIGAKELAKDFVVSGTASESLYGACEAMFKPDMEENALWRKVITAKMDVTENERFSEEVTNHYLSFWEDTIFRFAVGYGLRSLGRIVVLRLEKGKTQNQMGHNLLDRYIELVVREIMDSVHKIYEWTNKDEGEDVMVFGPEELFETISQALLSSVDRDCLSGWGGHVYVVTPTEVTERILKGRMD
ncbi:hypothetical protein RND71_008881 [Anisodus tanguticus]|uniref:Proteasome subunit beta n=1 Tax=Anisodus tanguticus TaxID=243964 RepID=A0AAE1SP86_9SOLA|nr:hypothetical protein RND71_008881 [Anisodus tanguticus]